MKEKRLFSRVRLSRSDKEILHSLEPVVESIAKAFGSNSEVVLHSLEDPSHSVIKIMNGHITGRQIGSPLTDFAMKILREEDSLDSDTIGSYYTLSSRGATLKCVTTLIRNAQNNPIGLLCINIDLSVPLQDFINENSPTKEDFLENPVEHFMLNVNDLIHSSLQEALSEVNVQRGISSYEKNKMATLLLYKKGIFNIKGAIDIVAKEMGISRYTLYNYIREAKVKT